MNFMIMHLCLVYLTYLCSIIGSIQSICDKTFTCADWGTAQICVPDLSGGYKMVAQVRCPLIMPFCNKKSGTCVPFSGDWGEINVENDNFICMKDGVFPDAENCNTFHICENNKAQTYQCATKGFFYNSLSHTCEKGISCQTLNNKCVQEDAYKVPFPNDLRFFAYCYHQKPRFVNKCDGDDLFDIHFQECKPLCIKEGKLIDSKNQSRFHLCSIVKDSRGKESYMLSTLDCPPETIFNKLADGCVNFNSYQTSKYLEKSTISSSLITDLYSKIFGILNAIKNDLNTIKNNERNVSSTM
ncbi:uncharacterized protein LOC142326807 [Lycorma delicatula]|uniref:uncharacterized protein LOC142326807 n=1 Tax=Lycorma delicatula TaxID=130591 RepID=UPI003F512093